MDKATESVGTSTATRATPVDWTRAVIIIVGGGVALVVLASIGLAFYAAVPLGAAATVAVVLLVIHTLHRGPAAADESADIPQEISIEDIGIVERDLPSLKRVIVIADKVQFPQSKLLEAVEHNFTRGVKYLFLVSAKHAQQEVTGYYKLFSAMAEIVLSSGSGGKLEDLIDIQRLTYNWNDYPYIFYQVELPDKQLKTLAFRGNQPRQGIANHYVRVDPAYAHTIARIVFEGAPEKISVYGIGREDFILGKEIEFPIIQERIQ